MKTAASAQRASGYQNDRANTRSMICTMNSSEGPAGTAQRAPEAALCVVGDGGVRRLAVRVAVHGAGAVAAAGGLRDRMHRAELRGRGRLVVAAVLAPRGRPEIGR